MPAPPKHRQAIVQAAAALFRKRGYAATGLADIVARSGAPKGSLYHYFPLGKAQIGEAAVRSAGALVRRTLEQIAAGTPDAGSLAREYARRVAGWMEQSGWRDGCPISTVLLETAADEAGIRQAGQEAFDGWDAVMAGKLAQDGLPPVQAAALARAGIALLEGSLIRARVARSPGPILEAGELLAAIFRRGATDPPR